MKHFALQLVVLIVLMSCSTEKDKHPEMPIFPQVSNPNYILTPFPYSSFSLYQLDNFVYAHCYDSTNNSHPFVIYNSDFKELKKLPIDHPSHIDASGIIYHLDNGVLNRYAPPLFSKIPLEVISIKDNLDEIRKMYIETHPQDSANTIKISLTVDSLFNQNYKNQLSPTLTCMVDLGDNNYLFSYKNKNLHIHSETHDFKPEEWTTTCPTAEYNNFSNSLAFYDKAIIDYSLQGSNHIALGLTANTIYYYKTLIGQDTLFFKSNYSDIQEIKTSNLSRVYLDGYHNLYLLQQR